MKHMLSMFLVVLIVSTAVYAYDLDAYGRPTNNAENKAYHSNTKAWDGYGKSYIRQGNQVNASDGSVYRPYGASSNYGFGSNNSCTPDYSTGGCL